MSKAFFFQSQDGSFHFVPHVKWCSHTCTLTKSAHADSLTACRWEPAIHKSVFSSFDLQLTGIIQIAVFKRFVAEVIRESARVFEGPPFLGPARFRHKSLLVRRWWPEVSPQRGPLAVPSKRRLDQRHHRHMAASLQSRTFWGSPLHRDVGRRRAADMLVVSTAFIQAASVRRLGNPAEPDRKTHCHAQSVRSARERLFTDAMPRSSWTSRGPMHCGTALMLTMVDVVGDAASPNQMQINGRSKTKVIGERAFDSC